jgi:hypothetical protein
MEERGTEGERRNPRRGFLSGDEAQARRLLFEKSFETGWISLGGDSWYNNESEIMFEE